MINKYIVLIITRIIEFAIIGYTANWIWNLNGVADFTKTSAAICVIIAYCGYLGVTLSNDYWEITRGEGEPMM